MTENEGNAPVEELSDTELEADAQAEAAVEVTLEAEVTEVEEAAPEEEEAVEEEAFEDVEDVEEEIAFVEEVAPIEPDPPEDRGPQDPEGIVTALSAEAFSTLTEVWESKGSPHQFDFRGNRWASYDRGEKFVRTGGPAGMEEFYNSLSIG